MRTILDCLTHIVIFFVAFFVSFFVGSFLKGLFVSGVKQGLSEVKNRTEKIISPEKHAKRKVVEVPFTYKYGQIWVYAKINGEEFKFALDTGCAHMQITRSIYRRLRSRNVLGKVRGRGNYKDATGKVTAQDVIIIERVSLGGMVARNVICSISESDDAMLLLGLAALKQYGKCEIDYNKRVVRFIR